MGIERMGYAHVRVTDMAEAKKHYTETLGLKAMDELDGKLYLKGWDEWNHHSVVLEEGGVGLVCFGFKVRSLDDLNVIEKRAQTFGATCERMSAGESYQVGEGLRITSPSDHVFELYAQMTPVDNEVGFVNPEAWPRYEVGVACPNIDHALVTAEDPTLMQKFLTDVFDFYPTEQVKPEVDSDEVIATWMTSGQKIHDLAVLQGPNGKLHHFAFEVENWNTVLKAADLFSMDDVPIDVGPTRHGITRGETIYFFDPSGNRNEVFAGGYKAYRDRPCVVWTADTLGKAIFYHSRQLNDAFSTVLT